MQEKRFKDATWWPQYLEAKALELFVNLEESEDAFRKAHPEFENEDLGRQTYRGNIGLTKKQPVTPDEFRKAYPDFAPGESWWDYVSYDGNQHPLTKALLESAGLNPPKPNKHEKHWRIVQRNLREFWDFGGFPLDVMSLCMMLLMVFDSDGYDGTTDHPPFGEIFDIEPESPYQRSLIWLNGQPWRAKTCKPCKRRFIASWQSQDHCSHHCAAIALGEYKRQFREDRAEQYNRNRRKARAKARAKTHAHL